MSLFMRGSKLGLVTFNLLLTRFGWKLRSLFDWHPFKLALCIILLCAERKVRIVCCDAEGTNSIFLHFVSQIQIQMICENNSCPELQDFRLGMLL